MRLSNCRLPQGRREREHAFPEFPEAGDADPTRPAFGQNVQPEAVDEVVVPYLSFFCPGSVGLP